MIYSSYPERPSTPENGGREREQASRVDRGGAWGGRVGKTEYSTDRKPWHGEWELQSGLWGKVEAITIIPLII